MTLAGDPAKACWPIDWRAGALLKSITEAASRTDPNALLPTAVSSGKLPLNVSLARKKKNAFSPTIVSLGSPGDTSTLPTVPLL